MISRLIPQDFIELLGRVEGQLPETIPEFPLEFFVGDSSITLYKQVASKSYKTVVLRSFVTDEKNSEGFVIWNGKEISFEEFIDLLVKNHKALRLLEPLEDVQEWSGVFRPFNNAL